MPHKVHLVQHDIRWEDAKATCIHVSSLLNKATIKADDLIVLPELFSVGFSMNVAGIGEKEDGITTKFLVELAKNTLAYVIGGVPAIAASGKVQNQAVCVHPTGKIIARYAKMQPFTPAGEKDNYEAGDKPIVFDWNGMKVAPLICYDLRFPEVFRAATKLGAEMFCVIANWPSPRANHRDILLPARALENQAYVAGVNRIGTDPKCEYNGRSRLIDPTGTVVADGGPHEMVLSETVDPAIVREFRTKFPFLRDIRDDLVR